MCRSHGYLSAVVKTITSAQRLPISQRNKRYKLCGCASTIEAVTYLRDFQNYFHMLLCFFYFHKDFENRSLAILCSYDNFFFFFGLYSIVVVLYLIRKCKELLTSKKR